MINLTHFVVAPLVPYFWGHSHWQVLLVQKIHGVGGRQTGPLERAHVRLGWKKWALLNVGSEWGMSHFMAITGYHWLNGYQKSKKLRNHLSCFWGSCQQTYLRHWWIMSISLQWIILYSYVWRIKINVGTPKDPHTKPRSYVLPACTDAQLSAVEGFVCRTRATSCKGFLYIF